MFDETGAWNANGEGSLVVCADFDGSRSPGWCGTSCVPLLERVNEQTDVDVDVYIQQAATCDLPK